MNATVLSYYSHKCNLDVLIYTISANILAEHFINFTVLNRTTMEYVLIIADKTTIFYSDACRYYHNIKFTHTNKSYSLLFILNIWFWYGCGCGSGKIEHSAIIRKVYRCCIKDPSLVKKKNEILISKWK